MNLRDELERAVGNIRAQAGTLRLWHRFSSRKDCYACTKMVEISEELGAIARGISALLAVPPQTEEPKPEGTCGCCNRCWVEGSEHEQARRDQAAERRGKIEALEWAIGVLVGPGDWNVIGKRLARLRAGEAK